MASFQEVGEGKYKLYVELGYRGKRRIRRTKTIDARNKTEARKELVKFEAELMSKHVIDTNNMTVGQFFPEWKEKYAVDHYGNRQYVETCNIIQNRVLPDFDTVKLKDITKMDVIMFIDDLKKDGKRLDGKKGKLSAATIRNVHKAFNGLMSVAEDWQLIDNNPCKGVKLPKNNHKKGNVYGNEEIVFLFNRLSSVPLIWQLIVKVAAVTGARQGEIVALEAKHLNKKDNTITLEQAFVSVKGEGLILKGIKANGTRKVSIPKELMKDLSKLSLLKKTQLMEVQNLRLWPKHTFLFSNEFGKPLRPDSVGQWWIRFLNANDDLTNIRFHDLRHTSATLLINQGVHAKVIQERLGHSTISTTMNVYGHVLDEADQEAGQHFNHLFASDQK